MAVKMSAFYQTAVSLSRNHDWVTHDYPLTYLWAVLRRNYFLLTLSLLKRKRASTHGQEASLVSQLTINVVKNVEISILGLSQYTDMD